MTPLTTNDIQQAGEVVAAVKAQVTYNWPAIAACAVLVRGEIRNVNAWARNVADWTISHGGLVWMIYKLIWNPPAK